MTDNQKKAAFKRVVRDGGRKSGEEQEDVNEEEDVGEEEKHVRSLREGGGR